MSTTLTSGRWPASAGLPAPPAWRFARESDGGQGSALQLHWQMLRHTSFTPGLMWRLYVALSILSLGIALGFWWAGLPAVLPFAGGELLLLGVALWSCSRHARDAESLTLEESVLAVEHRCGRQLQRAEFRAEWVRVEPVHGDGSLVELSGQGQRMCVGRYLRPHLRRALAHELRRALRRSGMRSQAPRDRQDSQDQSLERPR